MKKKACIILLLALLICIMIACSHTPAAKTEEQIWADLCSQDDYFRDYNLQKNSFSITKRQTNTDSKSDYVWCDLVGSNNDFTYSATYELTYILYNDGWLLDDYSRTSADIEPNSFPTESEATDAISAYYDGCVLLGSSKKDYSITYQFDWQDEYHYLITKYNIFLTYSFSPVSGWTGEIVTEEKGYELGILGEWEYRDADRYFKINVISVDDTSNEYEKDATISYYLENIHTDTYRTVTKSSDGPVNVTIRDQRYRGYYGKKWSITLDPRSVYGNIHIYIGVDNYSLTDSTGYGISCDGYFLTKLS